MSRQEEFTNFMNSNFDDFAGCTKMDITFQKIERFSKFFFLNAGMIQPNNYT